MYRRDFLRLGSATAASLLFPEFLGRLAAAEGGRGAAEAPAAIDWDKTVVLLELRGGNDGLNTIVPFADAAYYRARPKIAIPADKALALTKELGAHPALASLAPSWKDGEMAIALGLGYQQPNRSHFRGIDIWQSASSSNELLGDGWIARILDQVADSAPPDLLAHGIVFGYNDTVGYQGFGPLYGHELRNIIMNSADEFIRRARKVDKPAERQGNAALKHLLATQEDISKTADRMQEFQSKAPALQGAFPGSNLSRGLQGIGRLLAAGAKVPVFKVTLDGFDTHAGQLERHESLLRDFADSVAAFREAMKAAGCWDRILLMTYSEFGRRVYENDSKGTDHGTAAPHFILGGKIKGGFYGRPPSLTDLDDGDLIHTTDYRAMYKTVAQDWWGYKDAFFSQKGVKSLGFIRA